MLLYDKTNNTQDNRPDPALADRTQAAFQRLFEKMEQASPTGRFVSGPVFDIIHASRNLFADIVFSVDPLRLITYYRRAYTLFCEHPEAIGMPVKVNTKLNDTDPYMWNADIFELETGDYAALCFMPINDSQLCGRIFGIILSARNDQADGYYYCMLEKTRTNLLLS